MHFHLQITALTDIDPYRLCFKTDSMTKLAGYTCDEFPRFSLVSFLIDGASDTYLLNSLTVWSFADRFLVLPGFLWDICRRKRRKDLSLD